MLVDLSIRNLVLIDSLDLTFGIGFTVLTGETGAGKSILLDALGLALGGRGDAGLVRAGAEEAIVTATLAPGPTHPVWDRLAERGLPADEDLILRRHLAASGRSRAFVNDQAVSVGFLRGIAEDLVEIEGERSGRGLLLGDQQRLLLDTFGGLGGNAEKVSESYRRWRSAEAELTALRESIDEAGNDEDFTRHALAELDELVPRAGEETVLANQRKALMQGEKLAGGVAEALTELSDQRGVEQRLGSAQRILGRIAAEADGALDGALRSLDRAAAEAAETIADIVAAGQALAPDPAKLERVEHRLFGLRALARKHRVDVDDLPALRESLAAKLSALDDRGQAEARRRQDTAAVRAAFVADCRRLSKQRAQVAHDLEGQVTAELAPLKLRHATFKARLVPLPDESWSATGGERVSFEVATNQGDPTGPLAKIASGGELSRLVLAVRVALSRAGSAPTLVFDEVDSNIGGAVAAAVGARLARLGKNAQVLVVTHSPQVAARGRYHFRVVKGRRSGRVVTRAEALDETARREEVARMLSGAKVTEEARAAADRLLRVAS